MLLSHLLAEILGEADADHVLSVIALPRISAKGSAKKILTPDMISTVLCTLLLRKLLGEVPDATRYVALIKQAKRKILLDHGALRTVCAHWTGALPSGELAITRILQPLGYKCVGIYPLPQLQMTGRAYAHRDNPSEIPQFFVSEIYPEGFSTKAQAAAEAIFSHSHDPLDDDAREFLTDISRHGGVPLDAVKIFLPKLVACFDRQHPPPALSDYQVLLEESAEFAWIATEGNSFNHAADRVADLNALVDELRARQFAMKDEIEVSATGRVRQTAFKAAQVERPFRTAGGQLVTRVVPGSYFEFISRSRDAEGNLDLRFDSANAQAIFKMTAVP